jgi:TPR repeat protein
MVGMGEIYRGLFEAISFRLPMERMAQDLEDKSNLFLKAQSAYMRALRQRHPDWAPRAGYRLGALYERMYDDMVAADVPPELTPEQVEVYRATLRARVRPLIEQAIDIYDRNLMMARSLGADQAWLERSRAGLARLRRVLEE